MKKDYFLSIILAILMIGCQKETKYRLSGLDPEGEILFTKLDQDQTGLDFSNELVENIKFNGLQYEYYYNGSGLAVADFNNDGLKDIFFVSAMNHHKLFLNEADLKFKDVTQASKIKSGKHFSTGVTLVDINNDGWMDIYISNSGKFKLAESRKNKLYINMGVTGDGNIPTFSEQSAKYGLDLSDCSTQAVFFDYDHDGDLDMYLLNHYPASYPSDKTIAQLMQTDGGVADDRLMRNDNGHYTDISKQAGIIQNRMEYGLGVSVADLNNDGWPDIYVSNDYTGKDHLYMNAKNGTFKDEILKATGHISFFAMGNDIADINNDGWLDMMAVDMMGDTNYEIKTSMSGMNPKRFNQAVNLGLHHQYMYNTLQLNSGVLGNNKTPQFSEIAQIAGVAKTDWSWGPLFFDMDNDGLQDLFVSNGIKRDFRNNDFVNYVNKKQDSIREAQKFDAENYITDLLDKMPTRKKENYFFKNNGDLTFTKMNKVWDQDGTLTSSNGAAYADLDNDGDLDLVVNNIDDPAFILKNNAVELGLGHYLAIKLNGAQANRDGIGARVTVISGKKHQIQELFFTRGFVSAKGRGLNFGLGKDSIATVEIQWPDGNYQTFEHVAADQLLTLNYDKSQKAKPSQDQSAEHPLFEKTTSSGLDYQHTENEFDDYKRESLLPHKMSQEGPALAVGDINGDSLKDLYIGAASGFSGKIYIQKQNGIFVESNNVMLQQAAIFEDVASLFFDADGDGDLDLYVVSGGNENNEGSPLLRDRLYINNGKGEFSYAKSALPKLAISGSCVKVADYDNDGDLDLFIGARQVPGKYPASAKSYLLQNNTDNGTIKFDLPTGTLKNEWDGAGMVTDAVWIDLNKDSFPDLVMAGEWMPIRVFINNAGKDFTEKTEAYGLKDSNGWWFSLAVGDIDGDGDLDLVAGNLGLNFKYHASPDRPFEVYASDFDSNGTNDIVLGYYDDKELFPLRGRQCSSEQMPFIKKKFPTYDAFGKAAITDIFNQEQLENAIHLKAKTFASILLKNEGSNFKVEKLPNEAQLSSINTILIDDFDDDGNNDILLAGNLYGAEVETPRADASHGLLLKGDGKGNFLPLPAEKSGLNLRGEVKSATSIKIKNVQSIVFAKNQDSLEILEISNVKNLKKNVELTQNE